MADTIVIKGAREHNLKDIDLELPRNKLVVITGLSGSGKSSLAFDTIYAEGQRRYVESLSSYARQFLGLMEKPDVDQIDGLSPAISIDQKSTSRNPRSTVATVTEIYDYLRLLYARIGVPHCPVCGKTVSKQSPSQIAESVLKLGDKTRILLLAPIVDDKKGEFKHIPDELRRGGFSRVRVDGIVYDVNEFPELDKKYKHTIEVVVDRVAVDEEQRQRITESVEAAIDLGDGLIRVEDVDNEKLHNFSEKFHCVDHPEAPLPDMAPRSFSFNSPHGACPTCSGLGFRQAVDPDLVIPNRRLSVSEGAIRPWSRTGRDGWYNQRLRAVLDVFEEDMDTPIEKLGEDAVQALLYGTDKRFNVSLKSGMSYMASFEGIVPNLERRYRETESDFMKREIEKFMIELPCDVCSGKRLRPEILAVTVAEFSIIDITEMSIKDAVAMFDSVSLSERDEHIARQIVKEIKARLGFLNDVGLDYLTLARSANTLSGGEAQRIRLATQIGSGLTGVLYVLDEPSIGLHQRDNHRLIETLKRLRDLDNTVITVEHDEDTIREADYVVDIGPAAGIHGGEVVAAGTPEEVAANKKSVTGKFLSGVDSIPVPKQRREGNGKSLVVKGAREHNLKNIDVTVPLGQMVCITGVSGSGKSSLMNDIIAKQLAHELNRAQEPSGRHDTIEGVNNLDKAITIDQSPIGRTPRSNPATYTGLFTPIRELFASTPEAKLRGYKPGRFSFNVKGGRCETCTGDGIIKIEMHFLPDVYVTCEECKGQRYNRETLEIHYKEKTIADVLNMTVDQALEFFTNIPSLKNKLQTITDVGLGYIALGQSATTLSGGEAQRIKLSSELAKRSTGSTLYILDEPTTGLHFADVKRLLKVLNTLTDAGNTVLIIEHNLDVIKVADHIIDMGPEGGNGGGTVVAEGAPEVVAQVKKSYTGQFLAGMLK